MNMSTDLPALAIVTLKSLKAPPLLDKLEVTPVICCSKSIIILTKGDAALPIELKPSAIGLNAGCMATKLSFSFSNGSTTILIALKNALKPSPILTIVSLRYINDALNRSIIALPLPMIIINGVMVFSV